MHGVRPTVVLLAWLAATVVAAEKTSAETAAPPVDDTIAAAKRDLEAIKAARGGAEQPRATLPLFTPPEMQIAPQSPRRLNAPLSPADAAAAKRSANWLVDAMTAKTGRGSDEKKHAEEKLGRDEDATDLDGSRADGERDRRPSDKVERRDARMTTEPIVNPLANFMAGWMTPQDFKLLQPGMGNESAANLVARGETPFSAPVGNGSGDANGLGLLGRTPPSRAPSPPRENPFLPDLVPSAQATVNSASPRPPPQPMTAPAPAPKVFAPPPELSPKPAGAPAFVKPNDDAKYFKPLKRF